MSQKINEEMARLANARLPELRARFEEVVGEPTRAPNKVYLRRRIREGLEARERSAAVSRKSRKVKAAGSAGVGSPRERVSDGLTKLTVDELRARYVSEVGRETSSDNKAYLIWKVRMARAGKVRIGPARERKHEPGSTQVVPLTLPRDTVAALDDAVARASFESRSAFLRRAIYDLLKSKGFATVAKQHFGDA